jgi:hypothetical protein
MKMTWEKLTPTDFEELCYHILKANKYTDIQWHGKSGGDRGRDITAKKEESPLSSIKIITECVIQCKRYVKKPPTKRDIESFLTDAREHKPDKVLIIITNTITSNTRDWLDSVRQNYNFEIVLMEELALEEEVTVNRSQIPERFLRALSQGAPVTVEQVLKKKFIFSCSEWLNRIEIVALEEPSLEKAREDVMKFIKYLRDNNVDYDWQQTKKRRSRKRAS